MLEYLKVGLVGKAHGVQGELRVQPLCDDPQTRFAQLKQVFLRQKGGGFAPVAVTGRRFRPDDVLLRLEGVSDREAAQALCGQYLYVDRAHAAALPEDANFVCDLLGCQVEDNRGNALGALTEVMQGGGVDVYVVKTPQGGELLFPALKRLVLEVNVQRARILVDADVLPEVSLR